MKMRNLVISLLLLGACHQGTSSPDTRALRARVVGMLSGYEDEPTPEAWAALPIQDTRAVLVSLAADRSQPEFLKARALSALTHFGGTPAIATLRRTALGETGASLQVRRSAIASLAQTDPAASEIAGRLLADPEPFVREAAVHALGGHPQARSALREARQREKEPFLQRQLDIVLAEP